MPNTRTYIQKPQDIRRDWHLIDIDGQVLGHAATQIATFLIGKHKPTYTPNLECGDFVVVINAAKVVLTGLKAEKKVYHSHSGVPGGFKTRTYAEVLAHDPAEVIEMAVRGMLPKNKLQAIRLRRLKVFAKEDYQKYAEKFQSVKE